MGPHPLNQPGWAEHRIENDDDIAEVIALMRLNYDRVVAQFGLSDVS